MIPQQSLDYGFVNDGLGAHASRTIMLSELRLLLASCPPSTSMDRYRALILQQNVLLKQTEATRRESFRRLRELYGLNPNFLVLRALRDLWDFQPEAQPMLALLCAAARDPILRATAKVVLSAPVGSTVTPEIISKSIKDQFPGRFSPMTLASIGRHAASSWRQSGHLQGKLKKIRSIPRNHPTSSAYALFLGYLCGDRGDGLFDTLWFRLVCAPTHAVHDQAIAAARQGWLEYKRAGDVTEIGFRYLMRGEV